LLKRFQDCCYKSSDINQHLGVLWGLALQCEHVTEFGVAGGNSTTALLAAQPAELHCWDRAPCPVISELQTMSGRTRIVFRRSDSRIVDIVSTDLLFIDTTHSYSCLRVELRRHSPRVSRWIVIHDTQLNAEGGDNGGVGMMRAIEELIAQGQWQLFAHWPHSYGLTVLQREPSLSKQDDAWDGIVSRRSFSVPPSPAREARTGYVTIRSLSSVQPVAASYPGAITRRWADLQSSNRAASHRIDGRMAGG
jgi:hypothetical protein